MELYKIAIRALFAYFILHAMIRVSGKGEISQARAIDFVLVIIIGDMIDDLLWAEVPASHFVVGVATITLMHAGLLIASHRIPSIGALLDGRPVLLIRDGTLMRAPMRRERVTEEDIDVMLRKEGLEREDWPQVKSLMLDTSGRPALILHEWAREAQEDDRERLDDIRRREKRG